MINNITNEEAVKLESVVGSVFEPVAGWSFSHHAHIAFFKGKFLATWSNGRVHEDDLGQRVMLAESDDGVKWENVRPIVTPDMLGDPKKVLLAAGFHVHNDTLYLYYGAYNFKREFLQDEWTRPKFAFHHENTDLGYISTTDLRNWTQPKSMGMKLVPNFGPQKTKSGRVIITGNILFPYTDNPNGIEGYQQTGIYGTYFGEEAPIDDSESIHYVAKYNKWASIIICEGSFYQTDDDVLHMLLRGTTNRLWHSESRDDGETWSAPEETQYSDDGSKFHFGRLPSGKFYGVSNAKVHGNQRCPLDLYLSQDGENFNKHFIIRDEPLQMQFAGWDKEGMYAYPHTLLHDGYLYVIYSKCKEAIEVTKIAIDQLEQ